MASEDEKSTEPVQEIENDNTEAELQPEEERETKAEREARERREEAKRRLSVRRRKMIPPFVMLLAGAVVSIAMRLMRYDTRTMLIVLLCVLLVFYIIGCLIKYMMDRFERQIEEKKAQEGEVIEKSPEGDGTEKPVRETTEKGKQIEKSH